MKMSFRIKFPKASWDLSLGFLEKLTYLGFPPFFLDILDQRRNYCLCSRLEWAVLTHTQKKGKLYLRLFCCKVMPKLFFFVLKAHVLFCKIVHNELRTIVVEKYTSV